MKIYYIGLSKMNEKIHFIFMGKPSAGKGTSGQLIAKLHDLVEVSTGEALREIAQSGTPLGEKVEKIISTGNLVDDELITEILKQKLDSINKGIILDGYPRDITQAKTLENFFKVDYVIYFDAEDDVVINRITGRRTCPKCGKIYHIVTIKPKVDGICDVCGSILKTREDDTEEVMIKRLANYREKTEPVIDFYKQKGLLKVFNANPAFPDLKDDLINFFDELINKVREK